MKKQKCHIMEFCDKILERIAKKDPSQDILVIVGDYILEKKKNEVANCDDCIEIFLLNFLQFALKMLDPLHKAVSVDGLIGWDAFLELDL